VTSLGFCRLNEQKTQHDNVHFTILYSLILQNFPEKISTALRKTVITERDK